MKRLMTMRLGTIFVAALGLCLFILACRRDIAQPQAEVDAGRPEVIAPASRGELYRHFAKLEYDWDSLGKEGVPPLVIERFPDDYYHLAAGDERKRIFFLSLLPMVLLVNEEILEQRATLHQLLERHDRKEPLNDEELATIRALAADYKVERNPLIDPLARRLLFNRLDILPPSLVLAQAASESAYGTSRFARLGNNLFGEMLFGEDDKGIVPRGRPQGTNYSARTFPTLLDSLRAYMYNLNTHPAYQELRSKRAEQRAAGKSSLHGRELAKGLTAYSERGADYVSDIQTLIAVNRLSLLGNVTLRKSAPPPAAPPPRPVPTIGSLVAPTVD